MRNVVYILLLILIASCKKSNSVIYPSRIPLDSVYITADFRTHGDYYNTGLQVYAIDLLSDGLVYDSTYHIYGTGCNLYLSDVFAKTDSLAAGHYVMDSTVKDMTFLRGMDFEGSITGSYLLQLREDKIDKILLFTSGTMDVQYIENDIRIDFSLYTSDSTHYQAYYIGSADYRSINK